MNIFLHELKAYRKSTIIWTLSLIAAMAFFLSIFPSFSKDAAEMNRLIQGYPEALRKAVGITIDLSSILGYYSCVFLYIVLCGSIQAMNLGISIISKEVSLKTADFLLTKPVSRSMILTSKIAAGITSLIITNIFYVPAALLIAFYVKTGPLDIKIFIMISITLLFLQLIFFSLGFLISIIFTKIKSVISVSLYFIFGSFIINMFESVIGEKTLRYITPFRYFDTAYIVNNGSYETAFLYISVIIIIAAFTLSYIIYSKKDIHTV